MLTFQTPRVKAQICKLKHKTTSDWTFNDFESLIELYINRVNEIKNYGTSRDSLSRQNKNSSRSRYSNNIMVGHYSNGFLTHSKRFSNNSRSNDLRTLTVSHSSQDYSRATNNHYPYYSSNPQEDDKNQSEAVNLIPICPLPHFYSASKHQIQT